MSEWKEVCLMEITSVIGDGLHGTPKYDDKGNYYFINGNNLSGGHIEIKSETKRVSETEFQKNKKDLNERTILVSINGTIGNVAKYNSEPCILGKSACYFNVLENVDRDFVYYIVSSSQFRDKITNEASGTTIKNVSLKQMRNICFRIPVQLADQQRISSILSSLDAKIETNNRINAKLEEMAQALFKSWFIDFEPFQDQPFHETELGMVPEGWRVGSIYEYVKVIYGAPYKSSLFNSAGQGYPLIRIRDLKECDPQFWSPEILPNTEFVERGDILAGMDAEFVPRVWRGEKGILNQRICKLVPSKENVCNLFVYHLAKPQLEFVQSYKTGTTVSHLGKSDIDKFTVILPPYEVVKQFSTLSSPILERIKAVSNESRRLAELRDALLPKLMNGEIEV